MLDRVNRAATHARGEATDSPMHFGPKPSANSPSHVSSLRRQTIYLRRRGHWHKHPAFAASPSAPRGMNSTITR